MATKRKAGSGEAEENTLTGYIQDVTGILTSARGFKYFCGNMQTSRNDTKRFVSFSPEKHAKFVSAADINSPVKLTKAKLSPGRQGEVEVHIQRSTNLEVMQRQLEFTKRKLTDSPTNTKSELRSIDQLDQENLLSTINIKVVKFLHEKRSVANMYGEKLLRTAIVADQHGSMKMSFWNEKIDAVKENALYQITNAVTKTFEGSLIIATTQQTTIKPIPVMADVAENTENFTSITVIQVKQVQVSSKLRCGNSKCNKEIDPGNPADLYLRCKICGMKQRKAGLKTETLAIIEGEDANSCHRKFKVYDTELDTFFSTEGRNDLLKDADQAEDYLLENDNLSIKHIKDTDLVLEISTAHP